MSTEMHVMIKEAMYHAVVRKQHLPKKIDSLTFKGELQAAHIYGEIAGLERMLGNIVKNKEGLTVADIEAELHQYISTGLTEIAKHYELKDSYGLEEVLKTYGYYKKKESE